jgi:AraC-like DNA-binding protein
MLRASIETICTALETNRMATASTALAPGTPLPRYVLDSDERSEADRLAEWRDAIFPVFDAEPLPDNQRPDANSITSYKVGPMVFGQVCGGPHRFIRDAGVIARGGAEQLLIQLYAQGGYRGTTSAGPIDVRPLDISILDLDGTFETEADAFVTYNIVIARDLLTPRLPATESLHGLVMRREAVVTRILARHFLAMPDYIARATEAEADDLVEATLAILAATIKPVLYGRMGIVHRPGDEEMSATLRRYIKTNLADESVTELTKRFGVSRASLYRLFASQGGIAEFIRRERLRGAFRDLRTASGVHARIGVIARRWGFGSETAFFRAFRSVYGASPSQVRAGLTVKGPTTDDAPALSTWLTQAPGGAQAADV